MLHFFRLPLVLPFYSIGPLQVDDLPQRNLLKKRRKRRNYLAEDGQITALVVHDQRVRVLVGRHAPSRDPAKRMIAITSLWMMTMTRAESLVSLRARVEAAVGVYGEAAVEEVREANPDPKSRATKAKHEKSKKCLCDFPPCLLLYMLTPPTGRRFLGNSRCGSHCSVSYRRTSL